MSPRDLSLSELQVALLALDAIARAPGLKDASPFIATGLAVREAIAARTLGPCVYHLSLPLEAEVARPRSGAVKLKLAPRLNEYAGMGPWQLKLARAELDLRIEGNKARWPAWDCGSRRVITEQRVKRGKRTKVVQKLDVDGGRRRAIEVVRHSSREVDELAIDVLGGKLAVDRMIWAGVIAGDARKHVLRLPRWERAKPGSGRLEIAVFELPIT